MKIMTKYRVKYAFITHSYTHFTHHGGFCLDAPGVPLVGDYITELTVSPGTHTVTFYSYSTHFRMNLEMMVTSTKCAGFVNVCHYCSEILGKLEMKLMNELGYLDDLFYHYCSIYQKLDMYGGAGYEIAEFTPFFLFFSKTIATGRVVRDFSSY